MKQKPKLINDIWLSVGYEAGVLVGLDFDGYSFDVDTDTLLDHERWTVEQMKEAFGENYMDVDNRS